MSKIETMIKNFIRFFFHTCLLHLATTMSKSKIEMMSKIQKE
jgi:hypothetical protein